jgi:hypothetical protein
LLRVSDVAMDELIEREVALAQLLAELGSALNYRSAHCILRLHQVGVDVVERNQVAARS